MKKKSCAVPAAAAILVLGVLSACSTFGGGLAGSYRIQPDKPSLSSYHFGNANPVAEPDESTKAMLRGELFTLGGVWESRYIDYFLGCDFFFNDDAALFGLGSSLMFKYPFLFGPVRLYPTIGLTLDAVFYRHNNIPATDTRLYSSYPYTYTTAVEGAALAAWFDYGAGLDFSFDRNRSYLRLEYLAGSFLTNQEFSSTFRVALCWTNDWDEMGLDVLDNSRRTRQRANTDAAKKREAETKQREDAAFAAQAKADKALKEAEAKLAEANRIQNAAARDAARIKAEEDKKQAELAEARAKAPYTNANSFVRDEGYEEDIDDGTIRIMGVRVAGNFIGAAPADYTGDFYGPLYKLVIPSRLGAKPVTKIGNRSFYKNNLVSIDIPDTITEISREAFSNIPTDELTITMRASNVTMDGGQYASFNNGFVAYYNENGKRAGVYTLKDEKWSGPVPIR